MPLTSGTKPVSGELAFLLFVTIARVLFVLRCFAGKLRFCGTAPQREAIENIRISC